MKKAAFIALFAAMFLVTPAVSQAHSYNRDDGGHPLRYVAYLFHPVGIALEYCVTRPVHALVSSTEDHAIIFGHEPHESDEDNYYVWK